MGAGDHLMDVVPSRATLVVDSRLKVDLIDKVYNGLPVDLMFTAFSKTKPRKFRERSRWFPPIVWSTKPMANLTTRCRSRSRRRA